MVISVPASRRSWVPLWAGAVTASSFGPYVIGGLRTEQMAVYASTVFVLTLGSWMLLGYPVAGVGFLLLWTLLASVAAINAVGAGPASKFQPGDLLAGLDNLAAVAVLLLVVPLWAARAGTRPVLRAVAGVAVAGLLLNTAIVVVSWRLASVTWLPSLSTFWASGTEETVAVRALGNGRYTGIFNQPVEAGLAYSLGIMLLLYLAQTSTSGRRLGPWLVAGLIGMAAAGLLSGSKIFILGGVPVLAVLILRDRRRRNAAVVLAVLGILLAGMAWLAGLRVVSPDAYLVRLLSAGTDPLTTLTSGRFGDGGVSGVTDSVLELTPALGYGAGGLLVPYDSAWVEALVIAGAVGVLLLGLFYVALALRWASLRRTAAGPETTLGGGAIALTVLASVGTPALTLNRVGTLMVIVLVLTLLRPSDGKGTPGCAGASAFDQTTAPHRAVASTDDSSAHRASSPPVTAARAQQTPVARSRQPQPTSAMSGGNGSGPLTPS